MAKEKTMLERIEDRWPADVGPYNRIKGPRSLRKVLFRKKGHKRQGLYVAKDGQ